MLRAVLSSGAFAPVDTMHSVKHAFFIVTAALIVAPAALWSADAPFQVRVEVPADQFAAPIQGLVREWYPKINGILFGEGAALPVSEVRVVLEPVIFSGAISDKNVVPAYADGNTIHVNSAYLMEIPDEYRAMVVHELTHVVQQYPKETQQGWLIEGIADYVRHKYYEKDIEPRLHLDANGHLQGFEADRDKQQFETKGYIDGYTVTGAFLYWLEVRKDKDIVTVLNKALRGGRYSDAIFQQRCGKALDELWAEFVQQSKKS